MNNEHFLNIINQSFQVYLLSGPRSNEKLKILHGFIAKTLSIKLGSEYKVVSLGFDKEIEQNIQGRYIDKKIDITVLKDKNPIAGIAIKFVMSNYSQNSNNYFENMLGETANIRCNNIPYFQIIILTQNAPYFNNKGLLIKIEKLTTHNLHKYKILSTDSNTNYMHTPDKTLIYIVTLINNIDNIHTKKEYINVLINRSKFNTCEVPNVDFQQNVILNDFDTYITKVVHRIKCI